MRRILFAVLALLLTASSVFAAVAIEKDGLSQGVATTLNFAHDSAYSTDGSTFNLPMNLDLISSGLGSGGVTTVPTGTTDLPSSYSLVKAIASTKTLTLANGVEGQIITVLAVSRTGNLTLTASTKSGWSSILLDADGEVVTLLYIDDTYGWVVVGYTGATVTGNNAG